MISRLKKYTGVVICVGLAAIFVGAVVFFFCFFSAKREVRVEAVETVKLSTVAKLKDLDDITLCAHRGLSAVAPENSLAAFYSAVDMQYSYTELDVHETRDGAFVVMHDDTVNRMTNGEGYISDMTLKELLLFNIDNGANVETNAGQKIPTLAQVLEVCSEYAVKPIIEVKQVSSKSIGRLLEEIERSGASEYIISSFSRDTLLEIKKQSADTNLWLLSKKPTDKAIDFCAENQMTLAFSSSEHSDKAIKKAADSSVELACWGVNDADTLVALCESGLRFFITDTILPLNAPNTIGS